MLLIWKSYRQGRYGAKRAESVRIDIFREVCVAAIDSSTLYMLNKKFMSIPCGKGLSLTNGSPGCSPSKSGLCDHDHDASILSKENRINLVDKESIFQPTYDYILGRIRYILGFHWITGD